MILRKYSYGVAIVICLTVLSVFIQGVPLVKSLNFSGIIIAIILGILVKNTFGVKESMNAGVHFCSKKVLRLAIIFLGFKLSLFDVMKLGLNSVILILIVTVLTLLFVRVIAKKIGISRELALLIGSGTSICGASAIAAVNVVGKFEKEDVTYSIAIVTLFGTVFMIFYPVLFRILHLSIPFYSLWAGSSIHEVAQVVAAGFAASNQAGISATLVKLTRVLFIIPVTLFLSVNESKRNNAGKLDFRNVAIPWFVIMFLGVIAVNSLGIIPPRFVKYLINADNYMMIAAMVGLGLETSIGNIKKVGMKPVYVGALASLFISGLSALVILVAGLAK